MRSRATTSTNWQSTTTVKTTSTPTFQTKWTVKGSRTRNPPPVAGCLQDWMLFVRRSSPSITCRNSNSRRTTTSSGTSLKKQTFSCKESLIHGKSRSTTKWWNGCSRIRSETADSLPAYPTTWWNTASFLPVSWSKPIAATIPAVCPTWSAWNWKNTDWNYATQKARNRKRWQNAKPRCWAKSTVCWSSTSENLLRNSPGHAKTQAANRSRQKNTPRNHSIRNSWAKIWRTTMSCWWTIRAATSINYMKSTLTAMPMTARTGHTSTFR